MGSYSQKRGRERRRGKKKGGRKEGEGGEGRGDEGRMGKEGGEYGRQERQSGS